jgi:tetrahydrodipicolinate N-succinyltransferase
MTFATTHPIKLWFGLVDYEDWSRDCGDEREVTVIGNDVWLGYNAVVLGGAHIGHGSVIGAGAVVRGVIPPYSVVIGNPGVVVKKRFSEEKIKKLLELAWWNWSEDQIRASVNKLTAADTDELLAHSVIDGVAGLKTG